MAAGRNAKCIRQLLIALISYKQKTKVVGLAVKPLLPWALDVFQFHLMF